MASRLAADFSTLAGSTENAAALIKGLRLGMPITLMVLDPCSGKAPSPGDSGGSLSFSLPTRPMSYGNIRIALSLARAQLAREGIAQPTPQQLRAALLGSRSKAAPATDGILVRRAAGFGWGRIAHALGLKLGTIVDARASVSVPPSVVPPAARSSP
jgi:hypothetical protein